MFDVNNDKIQLNANKIIVDLEKDVLGEDLKNLLEKSLFYYCSGIDVSPISAFRENFPIYVYVDSFLYKDFEILAKTLKERLSNLNFTLKEEYNLLMKGRLEKAKDARLFVYETSNCEFFVLFIKADAIEGFESLYASGQNYIQPKCVCNYRYELKRRGVLEKLEKRAQFVLGHSFDEKFEVVKKIPYLGDYGKEKDIKLYKRLNYYLD